MKTETYAVELTAQQWDLVVLSLGYVYDRAWVAEKNYLEHIDIFARKVLRRRVNEIVTEIQATVPDAGSDLQG